MAIDNRLNIKISASKGEYSGLDELRSKLDESIEQLRTLRKAGQENTNEYKLLSTQAKNYTKEYSIALKQIDNESKVSTQRVIENEKRKTAEVISEKKKEVEETKVLEKSKLEDSKQITQMAVEEEKRKTQLTVNEKKKEVELTKRETQRLIQEEKRKTAELLADKKIELEQTKTVENQKRNESKKSTQEQVRNQKLIGQTVQIGSREHVNALNRILKSMSPLDPRYQTLRQRVLQYKTALDQANNSKRISSHQLLELGENVTVVASGIYMMSRRVGMFVMSTVRAYGEMELAVAKLRNGLRNLGDEDYLQRLIQQGEELQHTGFFDGDQIMNAQAMLATFKLTGAEIELLTPRLLDLAVSLEQTGQGTADLQNLAIQLGKAAGTELVGGLSRMGVVMTDTQRSQLRLAEGMEKTQILAKILDDNFKGLAETTAGTTVQEMKAFENALGDIKESIGGGFVESLRNQMKVLGLETRSTTGEVTKSMETIKAFSFVMSGGTTILSAWGIGIKIVRDELSFLEGKSSDARKGVANLLTIMETAPSTNLFGSLISQVAGFQKEILISIGLLENLKSASRGIDERTTGVDDFGYTIQLDKYGNPIAPIKPDTLNRDNWRGKTDDPRANIIDSGSGKGGKGSTGAGKEVDAFAELIKSVNTMLRLGELRNDLTTKGLRETIQTLETNEALVKNDEQRIVYLETMMKLESEIRNILFDKKRINVTDLISFDELNRNITSLPAFDIDLNIGDTLGVRIMELTYAGERFESVFQDSLGFANMIVGVLDLGADSFGAKFIKFFQDGLGMAGQIFSIISTISGATPGGGILSMIGGLFGGLFADGGTLQAGKYGIVGEEGPELIFSGSSPKHIMNSDQIMSMLAKSKGSSTKNVNNLYIGSSLNEMKFYRTNRKKFSMHRNVVRM